MSPDSVRAALVFSLVLGSEVWGSGFSGSDSFCCLGLKRWAKASGKGEE